MPVLTFSEQISGTADLKVSHRDLKARAKICEFPDRRQPLLRNFLQQLISPI